MGILIIFCGLGQQRGYSMEEVERIERLTRDIVVQMTLLRHMMDHLEVMIREERARLYAVAA